MFRFLAILLLLFVGVDSYGNNKCIEKHTLSGPGFNFKNCTESAEVVMQWKREHIVGMSIITQSKDVQKFKLIVNDDCELEFEGDDSYAKWTDEDDKSVSCSSAMKCDLQINEDGKLTTYVRGVKDQKVGCEQVRNELDENSLWSKFRIENLPADYKFQVFVKTEKPEEGEGKEFVPPSTTTSNSIASEASVSSVELGLLFYVLVALSIVILISVFFILVSGIVSACK
ncbi:hypothetical protein M3Y94_00007500 [Aphelenchoides besseyi]|nr:hypothetical protein M3Y94_00007500 [Aphelenchoides besseyi]KAI6220747.1 hypothetical protein M3Y95_01028900 [Aphelenchoides besseyi]